MNIKFSYLLALDISLQQYSDTKNSKCYSKFEIITKTYLPTAAIFPEKISSPQSVWVIL